MITYPIELAKRSLLVDRVVVSTEDDEIARIAMDAGAEVPFRRPATLSDDHAGTRDVIRHAIDALSDCDGSTEVCCIYPCTPLLQDEDLKRAYSLLAGAGEGSFIFPVIESPSPIERALRRGDEGITSPAQPGQMGTRTQDLAKAYFDAGQLYLASASTWLGPRQVMDRALTFVLDPLRVVDIDTLEDWSRAEHLAKFAERK